MSEQAVDLRYLHSMARRNTANLTPEERRVLDVEYAALMTKCLDLYGFDATNQAVWYGDFGDESRGGDSHE